MAFLSNHQGTTRKSDCQECDLTLNAFSTSPNEPWLSPSFGFLGRGANRRKTFRCGPRGTILEMAVLVVQLLRWNLKNFPGQVPLDEVTPLHLSMLGVSGNLFLMTNPTIIGGGTGLPLADALVVNEGNSGPGYNLGNSIPGTWTETLNGFQGGPTSAPVFLLGGSPIGQVTGTIGGFGSQEYYLFNWGGGAFSTTASITGASSAASYLFSEGVAGSCNSSNVTLNSGDSFTGTIAFGNLSPDQYCTGLDANSALDPKISLTFNAPVSGVPEPSGLVLLSAGLGVIGVLRRAKRGLQHS